MTLDARAITVITKVTIETAEAINDLVRSSGVSRDTIAAAAIVLGLPAVLDLQAKERQRKPDRPKVDPDLVTLPDEAPAPSTDLPGGCPVHIEAPRSTCVWCAP